MSLSEISEQLAIRLRQLPGVVSVPDEPPGQLQDDPMIVLYPIPGASTAEAHTGRGGRPVYRNADELIVEYHAKINPDEWAIAIPNTNRVLDATREMIWSEFYRNKIGGSVVIVSTIDTLKYGVIGWGSDSTFGFRLSIALVHMAEVAAGRT